MRPTKRTLITLATFIAQITFAAHNTPHGEDRPKPNTLQLITKAFIKQQNIDCTQWPTLEIIKDLQTEQAKQSFFFHRVAPILKERYEKKRKEFSNPKTEGIILIKVNKDTFAIFDHHKNQLRYLHKSNELPLISPNKKLILSAEEVTRQDGSISNRLLISDIKKDATARLTHSSLRKSESEMRSAAFTHDNKVVTVKISRSCISKHELYHMLYAWRINTPIKGPVPEMRPILKKPKFITWPLNTNYTLVFFIKNEFKISAYNSKTTKINTLGEFTPKKRTNSELKLLLLAAQSWKKKEAYTVGSEDLKTYNALPEDFKDTKLFNTTALNKPSTSSNI